MNEDNLEAWRRYVSARISELMKDDMLKEPEFWKILEQVKEDKRRREEYGILTMRHGYSTAGISAGIVTKSGI